MDKLLTYEISHRTSNRWPVMYSGIGRFRGIVIHNQSKGNYSWEQPFVIYERDEIYTAKDQYESLNKKVRFGRHSIKVTTYYLSKHKSGLRIEVRRFTWTQTVEIQLLTGDDVLILKKEYLRTAIEKATEKEVTKEVERFIRYAQRNLKKEQSKR